jgi:hypothetical protein
MIGGSPTSSPTGRCSGRDLAAANHPVRDGGRCKSTGEHYDLALVPVRPGPAGRMPPLLTGMSGRPAELTAALREQTLFGLPAAGSVRDGALNRYSRHQRIVDVFVTNVPGPQRPLYLLGARLLEVFPVVQVAGNVPLSVAVLSYAGQLNIGIQSDPGGCPTWTSSPTAYANHWRSWAQPHRPSPAEPRVSRGPLALDASPRDEPVHCRILARKLISIVRQPMLIAASRCY